mmetsp:Transcript_3726/g.8123  ORF Transcript_3726/g.8123 Transcript_3726/m.8123 type:complete len:595 (-) Transcript_3726:25-1809(-)
MRQLKLTSFLRKSPSPVQHHEVEEEPATKTPMEIRRSSSTPKPRPEKNKPKAAKLAISETVLSSSEVGEVSNAPCKANTSVAIATTAARKIKSRLTQKREHQPGHTDVVTSDSGETDNAFVDNKLHDSLPPLKNQEAELLNNKSKESEDEINSTNGSDENDGESSMDKLDDTEHEANDYEARRLAKIRENNDFLESLGLNEPTISRKRLSSARNQHTRVKRSRERVPREPMRRSSRLAHMPIIEEANIETGLSALTTETKRSNPVSYTPSGVANLVASPPDHQATATKEWTDSALKRIYCVDAHTQRPMFAAAGHGGRVAVFSLCEEEPLLSFKAFRGWCSSIQYLDNSEHLLAASNDGALELFDTSIVDEFSGKAQVIAQADQDLHDGGIFAMHVIDNIVATASKDASVAISQLSPAAAIQFSTRFSDLHHGVIKSVRLRAKNIFASTGNDACVHVCDIRAGKVSVSLEDVHDCAVNSVRWRNEYQVMTTCFSQEMRLFDIRKPKSTDPVMEFTGHFPRPKTIYHPLFLHAGEHVLVCGDKRIVTFDVNSGHVLSSGGLDFNPSAIALDPSDPSKVFIAGPQTVISLSLNNTD